MTTAFNNLELSGHVHILTDPQKVPKFENGLKVEMPWNFPLPLKLNEIDYLK